MKLDRIFESSAQDWLVCRSVCVECVFKCYQKRALVKWKFLFLHISCSLARWLAHSLPNLTIIHHSLEIGCIYNPLKITGNRFRERFFFNFNFLLLPLFLLASPRWCRMSFAQFYVADNLQNAHLIGYFRANDSQLLILLTLNRRWTGYKIE